VAKNRSEKDLIRKRKRLLALLPLVTADKADRIRDELAQIDQRIGLPEPFKPKKPPVASASGVDGVGGLQFEAQSPPGAGRLVRIPFCLFQGNFTQLSFTGAEVGPMIYTGAGSNTPDPRNPVVSFTMPNDASLRRAASGFVFQTPLINWSRLRVVGLETTQVLSPYGGNDPAALPTLPSPVAPGGGFAGAGYIGATGEYNNPIRYNSGIIYILLKNFTVGGGANLLSQEGYIDAAYYDVRNPGFAGLRASPELKTPNTASIEVAFVGPPLASVIFSINVVCDVQDDTEFGTYNVGPYDRPTTMRRSDVDSVNISTRS
tara:strand:+ start:494 stop:1447 length:954 start_codon:yes stop_codon:yes gene_type:complete